MPELVHTYHKYACACTYVYIGHGYTYVCIYVYVGRRRVCIHGHGNVRHHERGQGCYRRAGFDLKLVLTFN